MIQKEARQDAGKWIWGLLLSIIMYRIISKLSSNLGSMNDKICTII